MSSSSCCESMTRVELRRSQGTHFQTKRLYSTWKARFKIDFYFCLWTPSKYYNAQRTACIGRTNLKIQRGFASATCFRLILPIGHWENLWLVDLRRAVKIKKEENRWDAFKLIVSNPRPVQPNPSWTDRSFPIESTLSWFQGKDLPSQSLHEKFLLLNTLDLTFEA